MASTSNPFTDPEPKMSLPLLPPSLSITLPSPAKGAVPLSTEDAIYENEREGNPFADSPRPSTAEQFVVPRDMPHPCLSQLQSDLRGAAPGSNTQGGGTAVRDFGPTMSGGLTAARQGEKGARSAKSAEIAMSLPLITDSTLMSSVHGGARANPFADPVYLHPRARDASPRTPLPDQPSHFPNSHLSSSPSPSPSPKFCSSPLSSMGPTPPSKSPRHSGQRLTSLSSYTSRFGIRHSSTSTSNYSLEREVIARESARRQEERLKTARAQQFDASLSNLNEPRLRPSPSALRVAAELIRARDSSVAYGSQAVLNSVPFWISIFLLQAGLVSTSASIAVIIQGQSSSIKIYIGAGRVFWLVISIVVLVVGGVSAWIIWMRKKGISFVGGDRGVLRRLGCDEVGLLDRAIVRDMAIGRMGDSSMGPDIERGSTASPRPSSNRTYQPRQMPGMASMSSIVTKDPTWQVLYATPQELRQMVSRETIREESDDGGTPVRMGGAESMLSKDEDSINHFNVRSPVRVLDPQLTRSDTSWPLRSTPQAAPTAQLPSQKSAVLPDIPLRHGASSTGINLPTRRRASSTAGGASSPPNPNASRHRTGSRVEIQSPLAVLTRSIHRRRVTSEERVSKLRESLDSSDPSISHPQIKSNTSSLTSITRHGMPEEAANPHSRSNVDSNHDLNSAIGAGNIHGVDRGSKRPRPRSHSAGEIFTVDELLSLSRGSSSASSRPQKRDLSLAEFLRADRIAHEAQASTSSEPQAVPKSEVQPGGKAKKVMTRTRDHVSGEGRALGSVLREKIGMLKEAEAVDAGAGASTSAGAPASSPSTSPSRSPSLSSNPSPSPSPRPTQKPSPASPHAENPVFVIGEDSPSK